MNNQVVLSAPPLPARMDVSATARLLGFMPHDIPVLVKARLLKPLANPAPNGPKYFAACEVLRLASDVNWLDKATRAVIQDWRRKNQRRPRWPVTAKEGSNER